MRLQENQKRFFLSIPSDYIKLLGWTKGQELAVIPGAKELVVKEIPKR